ncbi:MAG: Rrf2 family transcriptional regulator [Candidatus Coatesbacteria bacterium]
METQAGGVEILTRGADYALRAMAVLAKGWEAGGPVPVRRIAGDAGVAETMLRKLLQKLGRARLVVSVRGIAGGFRLSRPPGEIAFLDVIEAVQGTMAVNRCFLKGRPCPNRATCAVRRGLGETQRRLVASLRDTTLAGQAEA